MKSLYAGVGRTFLSDAFDFGLIPGQGSGSRRGLDVKPSGKACPERSPKGMSDPHRPCPPQCSSVTDKLLIHVEDCDA
jgi:hypothetical protein